MFSQTRGGCSRATTVLKRYQLLAFSLALLATVAVVIEWTRPPLLLVGNVTVDLVDGKRPTGGAISYAAVVAAAYGVRACVVTAGGPDADLSVFDGHELHLLDADRTLTFEHKYTWFGHLRKLRVTAQPNLTLGLQHVPPHCRRARTVMLGPLTPDDLDTVSLMSHQPDLWDRLTGFQQRVGLMAQGLQRLLEPGSGKVLPFKAPSADLLAVLRPGVSVFLSDVETDAWGEGLVESVGAQADRLLVTRGELGADEYTARGKSRHAPVKVDGLADTNGAGDTFAVAYMLALARGDPSPGAAANWAGSRAVRQPQACKPGCTGVEIAEAYGSWLQRAARWAGLRLRRLLVLAGGRLPGGDVPAAIATVSASVAPREAAAT